MPQAAHQSGQGKSPQPQADTSQMFLMMFLLLFMLVIFNRDMRVWMGQTMGVLLEPSLGFGGHYPVLTIFLAGFVMIIFSTSVRHFFIDWMEMARIQKAMGAYNKELRAAQIAKNQKRVDKLLELQPELMQMQSKLSASQMKPMVFTMIIAIPIFMWLNEFVKGISYPYVSIPWEPYWNLRDSFILPFWVWLYSILSLPIGQAYLRFLKVIELKEEIWKDEEHIEENTDAALESVKSTVKKLKKKKVPVDDLEKDLLEVETIIKGGDFKSAMSRAKEIRKKAKDRQEQMEKAKEHLRSLEDMRKVAGKDEAAESDYIEAKKAFEKGDFASALYYSKQAKKILIESVAQKEYREGEIARIRDEMNAEVLKSEKIEQILERAVASRSREEFDEHIEQADRELENAIRDKERVMEFRDDVEKKMRYAFLDDEFLEDLKRIDEDIENCRFVDAKKGLDELNVRVLRRIKEKEGELKAEAQNGE